MESVEHLSAALEASLVRELRNRYDLENELRFGNRLRRAVIVLSDSTSRLGRWVPAMRMIEISHRLVLHRAWLEVVGVLEHEMAHQFVDEVLDVHDEPAHGPTFQRVCAARGIDATAAGMPVVREAPGEPPHMLDRIRKLLALAGSSNQHEAQLAMRKAHELMLRHNIESIHAASERTYEIRHLGDPSKRSSRVESMTAGLLAEFFFVKVIRVPVYLPRLGKRGAVYEIAGTQANLEMASHVYAFLLATADRLWRENRKDARVRSGRDRLSYQSGVIGGFREKLLSERAALSGEGLVWVGDGDLDRFYRARHPRIVMRRHTTRYDGAHAAGREAGRSVVLHKPVAQGPSSGEPKRLRG
jgi:hypothetical protein